MIVKDSEAAVSIHVPFQFSFYATVRRASGALQPPEALVRSVAAIGFPAMVALPRRLTYIAGIGMKPRTPNRGNLRS
jgi:hypothetical protein